MRITITCPCGVGTNIELRVLDLGVLVQCSGCGLPLAGIRPVAADVPWVVSNTMGPTLDPVTGAFRFSVVVLPDIPGVMHGAVARVFGDTEDQARALAVAVCRAHNSAPPPVLAAE